MKKEQTAKIIASSILTITTLCTIGIAASFGEALGMSYAMYGAAIGAIIGAMVGYALDHSFENGFLGSTIGAEIGSIIGLVYDRISNKDHKESGIDNSDYGKGLKCTVKAVQHHAKYALDCDPLHLDSCVETTKGFNEIKTCMGDTDHYHVQDGTMAA